VEELAGRLTGYGNRRNGLLENTEQITRLISLLELEIWKKKNSPPSIRVQFSNCRVGNDEIIRRVEPLVTRIERRPLPRLGNSTLAFMDGGFENINFGSGPAHERAVIVHRSRMFLVGAGTARQPLTGKIRKVPLVVLVAGEEGHVRNAVQCLIGNGPDITCVIGVRPL